MRTSKARTTGRNIFLALGVAVAMLAIPAISSAGEITVDIAPETINLLSHGTVVTVHTDVPFWTVDVYSVYLNGVAISAWKADDRGNFVAKFLMDDVKLIDGLVIEDINILQFVALTKDKEEIWGEAEVMVIDRGAQP